MGTKSFGKFRRLLRIVTICIVQMHENVFEDRYPVMCAEIFNQIRNNIIIEECTIICSTDTY
jgi:hypothetical protein